MLSVFRERKPGWLSLCDQGQAGWGVRGGGWSEEVGMFQQVKAKEGEESRSFLRDVVKLALFFFLFVVGPSMTLAFRHQLHQIQKSLDLSSLRQTHRLPAAC